MTNLRVSLRSARPGKAGTRLDYQLTRVLALGAPRQTRGVPRLPTYACPCARRAPEDPGRASITNLRVSLRSSCPCKPGARLDYQLTRVLALGAPRRTRGAPRLPTYAGSYRWQATSRPSTHASFGSSIEQCAMTFGQRVWNRQP